MSSPPRLVNTGLLAGAQDLLFGISVVSSQPNQAPAGVAQPAFEPAGADATAAWREQLWTHPGRTQIPPPPPGGDGPLAEAVVVHDGAAAGGGADLPSAQAAAPIDASLHITWATGHETAAPPRLAGPGAAVTAVPPLADVVYHVDDYANPDSIATAAPTAASQASGGGGGGPDAAADAAWGLAGTAPPRAGSVGLRTAAVLVGDRGRLELVRTAHGVWVVAFASGAVGAAGCAAGDRLVRVGNNTDVSGMTDAASLTLALERAARPVRLELLRPGVGFSVEVTSSGGPLGLGLVEDMAGAALVYSVEAGGQAARGGVCPCDVVVGADELVFGASGVLGVQASLLALRRPFRYVVAALSSHPRSLRSAAHAHTFTPRHITHTRLHLLRPSTLGRKCTLAAAAASAGLPRAVADDLLTRVVADDLSTTMPTTSAASSTAANGSSGTTTSSHPRPDSWETELEAALADGHHLPRTFGPKTVYLVRHAESVANRTLKSAWACVTLLLLLLLLRSTSTMPPAAASCCYSCACPITTTATTTTTTTTTNPPLLSGAPLPFTRAASASTRRSRRTAGRSCTRSARPRALSCRGSTQCCTRLWRERAKRRACSSATTSRRLLLLRCRGRASCRCGRCERSARRSGPSRRRRAAGRQRGSAPAPQP